MGIGLVVGPSLVVSLTYAYPCKPQFYFIKVVCKGYKSYGRVILVLVSKVIVTVSVYKSQPFHQFPRCCHSLHHQASTADVATYHNNDLLVTITHYV